MKHIKTFEQHKVNEWVGQKFFTGHESDVDKEASVKRIEQEIDDAIEKYNENPDAFVKYDVITLKDKLLNAAKENGYRGKVSIRKSQAGRGVAYANKYFIVYDSKSTPLADISGAAGGAYLKY